ncbi:hypothetical protein LNV08_07005 [Paucibacter sp. TC2R-5]|uniref:hypothetical protein n=1 Tax=Paucibacter sp. TC2R-5 TaxID=2893555 RepID=UPI0021E3662E|nr:hypothetical protein [Paucibacter sp. TC2R-5]MCV2358724.1 hypothetical protein [Paucibacter sp. TC2R-5]
MHRHAHSHGVAKGTGIFAVKATPVDGWGHQSGDLSCQLFDQLSQDHAPGVQYAVDASVQAHFLPAATPWIDGSSASFWKRGARGPPLQA